MLIPYTTDAPIYHWPFATCGLIIANTLVFILQVLFPEQAEYFILQFGIIQPAQWVTSFFMHADIFHILFNMLFLWVFGLVVEGKVGWWRMLLIYFCCGVFVSGLAQILMVFADEGGALGASGAISGVMIVAAVWAPENNVNFKLVLPTIVWFAIFDFEASVLMLVFYYVALDFLSVWFSGFRMSGSLAHLLGGIPGAVIAIWMLKKNYVNCEGYDFLSIRAGRRGQDPGPTEAEKIEIAEQKKREERDKNRRLRESVANIQRYIDGGHFELALLQFDSIRKNNHEIKLPDKMVLGLIEGLLANPDSKDRAIRLMELYVQKYQVNRSTVLLNLARLYEQHQHRPRKALRTIQSLDPKLLSPQQNQFLTRVIASCKQKIDAGVIEPID